MNLPESLDIHTHISKKQYHAPETAGRIMVENVPVVTPGDSIERIESLLLESIDTYDTINYIYVADYGGILRGVLSIKDLFRQDKSVPVSTVMQRNLVTVRNHTDQEKVAFIALKHNLKAVPVIDKDGRFLGAVPSDAILNVLSAEHSEDMLYSAGVRKMQFSSVLQSRLWDLLKARFPWLVLGLFGGMGAALIVGFFENLLAEQIILAMFIPLIVYMSDAVGAQTQTIFIRAMAIDQTFSFKSYIVREMKAGLLIGLALSIGLGAVIYLWFQSLTLTLTLSTSLFFTVISSVLVALLIPLLLVKMGKDAAIGSGPFATIVRDILSIVIYFVIAGFIMNIV